MNYRVCIMCSLVISLAFRVSTFSWMRLAPVLENVINTTKKFIDIVFLYSFPYILLSTLLLTKQACACHKQDGFILHNGFVLFTFESIYLKYLKYLQYGPKFEPSISNNM